MSTIRYETLADNDDNSGVAAVLDMFGKGLIRDGSLTTYELTGADDSQLLFTGQGFAFNGAGQPVSGRAASCQIYEDGVLLATVTDIDISASKLKALDTAAEFFKLLGKVDVFGGDGDDQMLTGNKGGILRGADGDEFMAGGKGDDKLLGGDGDDAMFFGLGRDRIDGGAGADTVYFNNSDFFASKDLDDPDLTIDLNQHSFQKIGGGASVKFVSVENILAGTGDDRIIGDAQANKLSGGTGKDTVLGGAGDDTIYAGSGNSTLDGGEGDDTLSFESNFGGEQDAKVSLAKTGVQNTGFGKDKISGFEDLTGGEGNDRLSGNAASNHIEGGYGDDTIMGGGGRDGLVGDSGADTFKFTKASVGLGNLGEILDFQIGNDLIDVSKVDANSVLAGDQDFSFIATGAFTGVAGQLRWSYFGNDTTRDILVSGDLDGDKIADFYIQLRAPIGALGASDFDF